MTIPGDTQVRRSTEPVETTIGTEVVLMTLSSGECYGLGETGSDVWRALEQPIQFAELTERLRAAYDAPAGVIEADVAELLLEMQRRQLVKLVSATD